ncbi:unnamed protein product [Larinioides sclopetarius]|uniref:Uncharacterized protein n=1 Tax=Larinioides sclopetarius TaxID=280406 RepID=A0AAV1ZMD7_9ARAC
MYIFPAFVEENKKGNSNKMKLEVNKSPKYQMNQLLLWLKNITLLIFEFKLKFLCKCI